MAQYESRMVQKIIPDLGAAAYLLMHGFRVGGRHGRQTIFKIDESEVARFDEKAMDYLSSDFHRFDACLMSLKKMGEYIQSS